MRAKQFLTEFPERAKQLVQRREQGVPWKRLEEEFGLDDNNGMGAVRIFKWVTGRRPPPPQERNIVKYSVSLDGAAQTHLEVARKYYKAPTDSETLRLVLKAWMTTIKSRKP